MTSLFKDRYTFLFLIQGYIVPIYVTSEKELFIFFKPIDAIFKWMRPSKKKCETIILPRENETKLWSFRNTAIGNLKKKTTPDRNKLIPTRRIQKSKYN